MGSERFHKDFMGSDIDSLLARLLTNPVRNRSDVDSKPPVRYVFSVWCTWAMGPTKDFHPIYQASMPGTHNG